MGWFCQSKPRLSSLPFTEMTAHKTHLNKTRFIYSVQTQTFLSVFLSINKENEILIYISTSFRTPPVQPLWDPESYGSGRVIDCSSQTDVDVHYSCWGNARACKRGKSLIKSHMSRCTNRAVPLWDIVHLADSCWQLYVTAAAEEPAGEETHFCFVCLCIFTPRIHVCNKSCLMQSFRKKAFCSHYWTIIEEGLHLNSICHSNEVLFLHFWNNKLCSLPLLFFAAVRSSH